MTKRSDLYAILGTSIKREPPRNQPRLPRTVRRHHPDTAGITAWHTPKRPVRPLCGKYGCSPPRREIYLSSHAN